jgi:hypothetical protein
MDSGIRIHKITSFFLLQDVKKKKKKKALCPTGNRPTQSNKKITKMPYA